MALEDDAWFGCDPQRWEQHEESIRRRVLLLAASQVQQQHAEQLEHWRDEWNATLMASQASTELQSVLRANQELERERELRTRLQTKLELVRADRDELRFQWKYVARQLTDIKARGVHLPVRVAGGYSSYPMPSSENVRAVVKWIVDYEVKRVALEARSRARSVGKRLKLKLELMRALAGPASLSPTKKRKGKSSGSTAPNEAPAGLQRGLSVALEYLPKKSLRMSPHRRGLSPSRHSSRTRLSSPSPSPHSSEASSVSASPQHSPASRSSPLTLVRAALVGN